MSSTLEKASIENEENLHSIQTRPTSIERDEIAVLSQEHRDYIAQRHGTLDIDPVPAFGDADPYNWPDWKV